jgi:hypothetical protein
VTARAWKPAERIGLVLAIATLFLGGYYGTAWLVDPTRAASLRSPIDDLLPFWPASVLVYAWVYPAAFLPAFVVGCPQLFRRTVAAYALLIVVSVTLFALFPVTAQDLRTDIDSLDRRRFVEWGTALLYRVDPPVNLFPSLHLGIATLGAMASGKARPIVGHLAFAALAPVTLAVCTVKQHFAADAVAGLGLAAVVGSQLLWSWSPSAEPARALPVSGLWAFAAVVGALYAACYAAFAAGW